MIQIEAQAANVCEESVKINVLNRSLDLCLLLQEDQLQPLFSGAAWAGTMVWDAAIELSNCILSRYEKSFSNLRVLELGAGIGVPGMIACIAGAQQVIITEQEELLPLLVQNISSNFSSKEAIEAKTLSWGEKDTKRLEKEYPDGFDLILSCDCIYEPLYGESYKLLADTLNQLCGKSTIALVAVERRNQDGVDKFQSYVAQYTDLHVNLLHSKKDTAHIEFFELKKNQT